MNQQNFKTEPTEETGEVEKLLDAYGNATFVCGEYDEDSLEDYRVLSSKAKSARLALNEYVARLQREKEELERKVEYGATVVADMTKHGSSLLAVERNRAEAAERELAAVREDARKWKVWMALRKKLWSGNFDQSDRDLWKILTGDMATEEQIDAALQQDTKDRP